MEQGNVVNQAPVEQQQQPQGFTPGSPESDTPSSGYIKNAADVRRDEARQQPQVEEQLGYNLDELSQKLGVDPNTLGQPEVIPPPPPVNVEDWYNKQFSTVEAKQFEENFKKHLGIDIKEVYQLIQNTAQVTQGVEQWRQQVTAQQQAQQLQQELGNEFESLMPLIGQRFKQIQQSNPKQAAALDNLDGARMLAALIRQENQQQRFSTGTQPDVPSYLPNRRPLNKGMGNQSPTIKMSDFINWSDADVQSRMSDIIRAKQNGTFIHDI